MVASDAAARAAVEHAKRSGDALPALGLLGGDLCRTVGGRGDEARIRSGGGTVLPVDLGAVLVDGRRHSFVAHCVVRGRTPWRGRVVAAMNAQYVGRFDVAPRSHPGDGRLDVIDVSSAFSTTDRWKAWRRLAAGTHLPHPRIAERRVAAIQLDVDGLDVWLDGERVGPARSLSLRVEPDALTCLV
jgi:diacylglycerol kinase family enzyme